MAAAIDTHLDEHLEIAAGRRAPYSQLGDWVALSGISDHAKAMYWHLSMHINQQRGDFEVWPTRYVLAQWCGFSRPDSVDRYLAELVEINAVEIYQRRYGTGMRRRNVYVINQEPPPNYTGVRSLKEFYVHRTENRSVLSSAPSSASKSVQNTPKFSKSPVRTVARSSGSRDTRSSGSRDTRSSGSRDTRSSGYELKEEKQDERNHLPQPPSSVRLPNSPNLEEGE